MNLKVPESITFAKTGFCPGCGHGIAIRLIAEVMEEMALTEKLLAVVDVACSSLAIDMWRFDTVMAAHGRPIPTAVGVKHIRPENPVMAYFGDGAAYNIGMAETVHAALRNDNICVFVVNNSVFGMTGGQMAATTLPWQKTVTSPYGKDPKKYGTLDITKVIGQMDIAYLARGELSGAAGIEQSKKMIKKAFEKQLANEGFCLVELLSECPTNLGMAPVDMMKHVHTAMAGYFKPGEFIDKGGSGR
ncbi:MAG: 2-oxoglutarate oxidoreductase [Clostridiales Family XIII bacterium]|jgi:2-oxoglutarate ferredoxin oxidoreductase subunit beta|nr:2-oxoglutarate oxidoreductase [Clostridiales Family XIII bacterium]